MTSLQPQARALGDPTRYAIYRYLVESESGAGIAQLTAHFELNHNAIRQHLSKLVDAGLVLERLSEATGPGRRRLHYQLDPTAGGQWSGAGPYERLSLLLTEIVSTGDDPVDVGRRAGRRDRMEIQTSRSGTDAVGDIVVAMTKQGFDPEVRAGPKRVQIVLRNCPFESTAVADPGTVCALHLGIAEGLVEGSEFAVDEFVSVDPRRAKCRLRLSPAR